MASTRMATGDELVTKFIRIGEPLTVAYNSRVPIVTYVPNLPGIEVRYNLWKVREGVAAMDSRYSRFPDYHLG